jgi:hypothetical protein
MELTMQAQDDPTPWELPVPELNNKARETAETNLKGRGYFSQLGIVRRKPGKLAFSNIFISIITHDQSPPRCPRNT